MQQRFLGILVLLIVTCGCNTYTDPSGSSAPPHFATYQPCTLQELAKFLSKQLPGTWEVEKSNRVNGRERDNDGNWEWSCILINNPNDSDTGRRIAQEMGTLWSSRQFVVAHGKTFILIGNSEIPEVKHVADVLNLTLLDPPKDIRTFMVADCGLIWNGLKLERVK